MFLIMYINVIFNCNLLGFIILTVKITGLPFILECKHCRTVPGRVVRVVAAILGLHRHFFGEWEAKWTAI